MQFSLDNNVLTLFFEGELNSYNADDIEKEIEEVTDHQTFQALNLDFGKALILGVVVSIKKDE